MPSALSPVKIIEPSFKLLRPKPAEELYQSIEEAGRVCWRSEGGDPEKRADFIRRIIRMGHESVLEHESVSALVVCDRGIMAELTRHRLASFSVESTRYCRYDNHGVQVIKPDFKTLDGDACWMEAMEIASENYQRLLRHGQPPELARSVLPMSLATTLRMTANMREWRHILRLRTSKRAHPQMRGLMAEALAKFHDRYPVLFEDIWKASNAA